jgi:hypothetical protein
MNPKDRGLLSIVGVCERTAVENELSLSFTDPYDSIRDVRELARDLEKDLNRVLYGVRPDGLSDVGCDVPCDDQIEGRQVVTSGSA